MLIGLTRSSLSEPSGVPPSAARQAVTHLAFFLAYVALFRISYIFQISDLRSTPWNPESGIAVVSGVILGWSSLPVIFLASIVSKLTNPTILAFDWEVVAAIANAIVFAGSAAALRRLLPSLESTTTASIVLFIVYAVIVTLGSAISRLVIASLALHISPAYLINYALTLSVGNVVGVLTIVPLFFVAKTAELVRQGTLVRVLEDWCEPFDGYYLCYPSRRQPSPAFSLLLDALRYRE